LLSQSQRQGGKRVLLVLLQLRHSRRRIWDAGHGPCWVNDDCFPRVISHDDPPIPGRDLKCAVRRVFVMVPSSKKASDRLAAWISRMVENASAASVRMPIPPSCAAPRILAKGVSILRPPAFTSLPAMKVKAPLLRLNRAEFEVPSQTNSFSATRALFDRLNAVPSMKVIPTAPSAPVSMVSCR